MWVRWARSSCAATVGFAARWSRGMTFSRVPWSARKPAEKGAVGLALALYAGLLAYMIPRHEPWADEAQAWELAQSLSLKSLFGTYIHYEGSPGLWHALLWMLSRMHVTYSWHALVRGAHRFCWYGAADGRGALSSRFATAAALYLLLRLPVFGGCAKLRVVSHDPVRTGVLLAEQASAAPAGCSADRVAGKRLCTWFCCGSRPSDDSGGGVVPHTKGGAGSQESLAGFYCSGDTLLGFAAWCIIPARDTGWLVVAKRVGTNDQSGATVDRLSELHPRMHLLSSHLKIATAIIYQCAHELGHGLADKFHLGIIVWILLVWGWARNGLLRYSLPLLFLWGLYAPFPSQFYHAGLMWVLFLFLWWVTWQERIRAWPECEPWEADFSQKALFIAVMLCVAFHLVWAMTVIRYDASNPYSPNLGGAAVLKAYLDRGDKVDVAVPPNEGEQKTRRVFCHGYRALLCHGADQQHALQVLVLGLGWRNAGEVPT